MSNASLAEALAKGDRHALRRRWALVLLAGLTALALAPSAVRAHTLSESKALRAAERGSRAIAENLDGQTTLQAHAVISVRRYRWGPCLRRRPHEFVCAIRVDASVSFPDLGEVLDYVCTAKLSVSYRDHRSRRLRLRLPGGPGCE